MNLIHLPYEKINKTKWDDCIYKSINKLIYAEAIYLDTMCDQWDAIILDDYEAVMPLPWRKKFGIKYIFQPAFTQQSGIFTPNKLSKEIVNAFIDKASQHFKFGEFSLNYCNQIETSNTCETKYRSNFILCLNDSFEILQGSFNTNFKRELKKSQGINLKYLPSNNIKEVFQSFKKIYKSRNLNTSKKDLSKFEALCMHYHLQNSIIIRKVVDEDNNLLAIVLLLKDEHRLYNLMPCLFEDGKKSAANHFLFASLIKEFSEQNLRLDFEGSDNKGIAQFYQKMTSENQPYPFVKFNNLHPVIKLIKK